MKLEDLARELGAECRGPADLEITGVAGIEDAVPGQLTFIANQKYAVLCADDEGLRHSRYSGFCGHHRRHAANSKSVSGLRPGSRNLLSAANLRPGYSSYSCYRRHCASIGTRCPYRGVCRCRERELYSETGPRFLAHAVIYPGVTDRRRFLRSLSCRSFAKAAASATASFCRMAP